jgi:hypothetical protein
MSAKIIPLAGSPAVAPPPEVGDSVFEQSRALWHDLEALNDTVKELYRSMGHPASRF